MNGSYAPISISVVRAAAAACILDIEGNRAAALRELLDREIDAAKRGFYGLFSQVIDDSEAMRRLHRGGIDGTLELHGALNLHEHLHGIASKLLHLARFCEADTIVVGADDFAAIAPWCGR